MPVGSPCRVQPGVHVTGLGTSLPATVTVLVRDSESDSDSESESRVPPGPDAPGGAAGGNTVTQSASQTKTADK